MATQLTTGTFERQLAVGKAGESLIARWLRSRGYNILPVYEVELGTGKGPRVFTAETELIAPDILAFNRERMYWVEAKHKSTFSKYRRSGEWVTGIDQHHFEDYVRISHISPWPIWLMFLQRGGRDKDTHEESPSGLYGGELSNLAKRIHHRHDNWGKTGMVYWAHDTLSFLAPLAEVYGSSTSTNMTI